MRPAFKWWGWGDPNRRFEPTAETWDYLWKSLRTDLRGAGAEPAIPTLPERVPVCTGLDAKVDDDERLGHATGRSYLDLLRLRRGRLDRAPDAVLYPASAVDVASILQKADCAVVPFGGGTSVVGGVEPLRGDHRGVAALDTSRLDRLLEVDRESLLARVEAGIFGPALEGELRKHGLSLGHFPQSFEFSTLGGWIAARSAGQNSTKYGRIENMVAGLRVVLPTGDFSTRVLPATATGPELRELMVGSEGTLGIIVEATLRVHPLPETRAFRSYLFPTFEAGVGAVRRIAQSDLYPAIVRLSDVEETSLAMKLAGAEKTFGYKVLRFFGKVGGTHLMLGFEGTATHVDHERRVAHEITRQAEGFSIGAGPGEKWEQDRFAHPYLRDALMSRGLIVETLETATTWSKLMGLYHAVKTALKGVVLCHISHVYPDGASLYFTVISDAPPGEEEPTWLAMKRAACDAIIRAGGTLSHHHGVGADHRAWMAAEKGKAAVELFQAVKRCVDPRGILNPGKLF